MISLDHLILRQYVVVSGVQDLESRGPEFKFCLLMFTSCVVPDNLPTLSEPGFSSAGDNSTYAEGSNEMCIKGFGQFLSSVQRSTLNQSVTVLWPMSQKVFVAGNILFYLMKNTPSEVYIMERSVLAFLSTSCYNRHCFG